jgi:hypothetical protein
VDGGDAEGAVVHRQRAEWDYSRSDVQLYFARSLRISGVSGVDYLKTYLYSVVVRQLSVLLALA